MSSLFSHLLLMLAMHSGKMYSTCRHLFCYGHLGYISQFYKHLLVALLHIYGPNEVLNKKFSSDSFIVPSISLPCYLF